MNKEGHRIIAPVFSIGATLACMQTGLIPVSLDPILVSGLSGCLSLVSCCWPDADQLSLLPIPIIMGTAKKRYSDKFHERLYYVKVSKKDYADKYKGRQRGSNADLRSSRGAQELAQELEDDKKVEAAGSNQVYVYYDKCSSADIVTKIWAVLFKLVGLKKHRGWQSHSLLLWTPIWFFLIWRLLESGHHYLTVPLMGIAMGYLSHLVGDLFTMAGGSMFSPEIEKKIKKKKIIGPIYQFITHPFGGIHIGNYKIKFKFASANNKSWAVIVACFMGLFFTAIISPVAFDSIMAIVGNLFGFVIGGLKVVATLFLNLLKG